MWQTWEQGWGHKRGRGVEGVWGTSAVNKLARGSADEAVWSGTYKRG